MMCWIMIGTRDDRHIHLYMPYFVYPICYRIPKTCLRHIICVTFIYVVEKYEYSYGNRMIMCVLCILIFLYLPFSLSCLIEVCVIERYYLCKIYSFYSCLKGKSVLVCSAFNRVHRGAHLKFEVTC